MLSTPASSTRHHRTAATRQPPHHYSALSGTTEPRPPALKEELLTETHTGPTCTPDRRHIVGTLAALAATGTALTACGDHKHENAVTKAAQDAARHLARIEEVPQGGGLVIDYAKIVLVRGTGDDIHAYSAICPPPPRLHRRPGRQRRDPPPLPRQPLRRPHRQTTRRTSHQATHPRTRTHPERNHRHQLTTQHRTTHA